MRAEQYQRQLDAVTDYLYAHLDDDLSLDRLADVSGFSPYHWHRIYRAVRGETAAQTVRRLRLERAATILAQNAWPLERIARRAGFTSADAFSRAFQRAYDRTPGRFRSDRAGGPNGTGDSRRSAVIPDVESPTPYPVRVEERPECRLAVAEHRGSYMGIGRAFARVVDRMGLRKPMVAIYEDDPDAVPEAALRPPPRICSSGPFRPGALPSCDTPGRMRPCTPPTCGSTVSGCPPPVGSLGIIQ